jgi:autophagy-related protein 2
LCLLGKAPRTNSHVSAKHWVFAVFDISGPDSIDQHAFQDVPEVGAAPDMIYDDLPSNPDYLDVSFGAAAGLRELDDDDLDMDDQSRSELTGGTDVPSHSADKGFISSVGGETIRLFEPVGLHVVENFFNTLPALVESSPQ